MVLLRGTQTNYHLSAYDEDLQENPPLPLISGGIGLDNGVYFS